MVHRTWLLVTAVVSIGPAAWAQQGFALDRFNPAEAGSEWFVLDSLDLKSPLKPAVSLVGELARRPLATYGAGGVLRTAVVDHQATLCLNGSVVLHDQVRLALSLPVVVYQNGVNDEHGSTTYAAPAGPTALGDIRFSADARLLGAGGDPFSLAAGVQLFIPSGRRDRYTSDGTLRILGRLMVAGELGVFAYAAQLGAQHRTVAEDFGQGTIGNEAQVGCAIGVRLAGGRLLIGPEFFGSTVISKPGAVFTVSNTPMEFLLGAHLRLPAGVRLGLGAGVGLLPAIGSPQARFIVSLGWQPEAASSDGHRRAPDEPRDPGDDPGDDPVGAQLNEASTGHAWEERGEAPHPASEPLERSRSEMAAIKGGSGPEPKRLAVDDQPRGDDSRGPSPSLDLRDSRGSSAEIDLGDTRGPSGRLDLSEPVARAPRLREGASIAAPRGRAEQSQGEPGDQAAGLDPSVISKTIGRSARLLRGCIETELRRHPRFKGGKVVLGFRINPSGVVSEATVQPRAVDGTTMGVCLKEKARRIVFPAFEGEAMDVEFPLVLGSGS